MVDKFCNASKTEWCMHINNSSEKTDLHTVVSSFQTFSCCYRFFKTKTKTKSIHKKINCKLSLGLAETACLCLLPNPWQNVKPSLIMNIIRKSNYSNASFLLLLAFHTASAPTVGGTPPCSRDTNFWRATPTHRHQPSTGQSCWKQHHIHTYICQ